MNGFLYKNIFIGRVIDQILFCDRTSKKKKSESFLKRNDAWNNDTAKTKCINAIFIFKKIRSRDFHSQRCERHFELLLYSYCEMKNLNENGRGHRPGTKRINGKEQALLYTLFQCSYFITGKEASEFLKMETLLYSMQYSSYDSSLINAKVIGSNDMLWQLSVQTCTSFERYNKVAGEKQETYDLRRVPGFCSNQHLIHYLTQ